MLTANKSLHLQLIAWAEGATSNLAEAPKQLYASDLDTECKIRAMRKKHLPVIDYLHSIGMFRDCCWSWLEYIPEGLQLRVKHAKTYLYSSAADHCCIVDLVCCHCEG